MSGENLRDPSTRKGKILIHVLALVLMLPPRFHSEISILMLAIALTSVLASLVETRINCNIVAEKPWKGSLNKTDGWVDVYLPCRILNFIL